MSAELALILFGIYVCVVLMIALFVHGANDD